MTAESVAPEVLIRPDADAASDAAADRIALELRAAVEARGVAHWVTTGGSTPGPIYRRLAAPPLRDTIPWARVHLWWGDDRWVAPTDELSNTRACRELLLDAVPLPPDQVHPMPIGPALRDGRSPSWAAVRYAEALRGADLELTEAGFPVLDLVFVGVGPDGHVLSVFPGSPTWDDPAWVQPVPAPTHIEPHVGRLTLHPRILEAARVPLAVVLGGAKAEAVERVFGPTGDVRDVPARIARRSGAVWILDPGAAARLAEDVRPDPAR